MHKNAPQVRSRQYCTCLLLYHVVVHSTTHTHTFSLLAPQSTHIYNIHDTYIFQIDTCEYCSFLSSVSLSFRYVISQVKLLFFFFFFNSGRRRESSPVVVRKQVEMASGLPYFDPDYENMSSRINPPRVSVDNTSCKNYTLVQVDSVNKPGILLEVVQILSDLDLSISKAYISSDGGWFMDVFHVTDQQGNKITDSKTINDLEQALEPKCRKENVSKTWSGQRVEVHSMGDHTVVELIGRDRPGLLSEVSAILSNLHINVVAAEVWTHNHRVASVVYVNNNTTCRAVDDPTQLSTMKEQLRNILGGCEEDEKVSHTDFYEGSTHIDRRLHQMLFADRDYEGAGFTAENDHHHSFQPNITIDHCEEKGYAVVSVRCKDRSKLMFDIVCTLTYMKYVVFHASISSDSPYASQEYYIRHVDGCTLNTDGEKERVIKCLEAAIRRRVSEGLRLELCAKDRVGLLSEVTRVLRENGLIVARAGVTTVGEQAMNIFYIRDSSGNPVNMKTIEELRKEIGHRMMLNVKMDPASEKAPEASRWTAKPSFSLGGLMGKFLS